MDFIVQNALKNSEKMEEIENLCGQATIKVIGCGGAGCNMADWLYKKGVQGAEIIAINTDQQHLDIREADKKILLGKELTRGLGTGGIPQKGTEAAKESSHELKEVLRNTDMVFVTAGLGGGTGTGSAPYVAQLAKEAGCIVIGVVTMPFSIEKARIDKAEFGLKQLRQVSDTVIVIDNNRLSRIAGNLPIQQAFAVANEIVSTMIKGIVEIIAVPSLINMDFADVKNIMSNGDVSVIGIGEAASENKVDEAVKRALENPLLEVTYKGASGALIHITGGKDLTLEAAERVGQLITSNLDSEANVMWGARIDEDMKGKIRVMTIITGVQSPYVLGKQVFGKPSEKAVEINRELGIQMIN